MRFILLGVIGVVAAVLGAGNVLFAFIRSPASIEPVLNFLYSGRKFRTVVTLLTFYLPEALKEKGQRIVIGILLILVSVTVFRIIGI